MSYESAVKFAKRRSKIRAIELASELGCGLKEAIGLVKRLEQNGVVGPADSSDWHTYIGDAEEPTGAGAQKKRRQATKDPQTERIEELEAKIERLQDAGRTVIAQREEWKERALAAEAKTGPRASASDTRFARVKRLVALELHPDHSQRQGIDRLVREEIFKQLWPQIAAIEEI